MMIDNQQVLADARAVSSATTTVSTNKYDTGLTSSKLSAGKIMGVAVYVDVAADAADGDETYTWSVASSAAADLSGSTAHASIAVARATLIAGYKFFIAIPPNADVLRYVGTSLVTAGTSPAITTTEILMSAEEFEVWKGYPNGYSVS